MLQLRGRRPCGIKSTDSVRRGIREISQGMLLDSRRPDHQIYTWLISITDAEHRQE